MTRLLRRKQIHIIFTSVTIIFCIIFAWKTINFTRIHESEKERFDESLKIVKNVNEEVKEVPTPKTKTETASKAEPMPVLKLEPKSTFESKSERKPEPEFVPEPEPIASPEFERNSNTEPQVDVKQVPEPLPDPKPVLKPEIEQKKDQSSLLNCPKQNLTFQIETRGKFKVLKNFFKASHGPIGCLDSVTFATQCDYRYLEDNLLELVSRWNGPISLAVHAPGSDFYSAVSVIQYLRKCFNESEKIQQFVTFHLFFEEKYTPENVKLFEDIMKDEDEYMCNEQKELPKELFRNAEKIFYPINTARNIAKEAALTHYILVCSIEMYPTRDFPEKFIQMIKKSPDLLNDVKRVYVLYAFEMGTDEMIPADRGKLTVAWYTEILKLYQERFRPEIQPSLDYIDGWFNNDQIDGLNIFQTVKRKESFRFWEPYYVGTLADPPFDERVTYESQSNKLIQSFALCLLDYDFSILDNAFLVHRVGITEVNGFSKHLLVSESLEMHKTIYNVIVPQYLQEFGSLNECGLHVSPEIKDVLNIK